MKRLLIAVCALALLAPSVGFAAEKKAKYKMRVGSIQAQDFYLHKMIDKFAELVKQKTDGEVEVVLAPSSTLGNERDMIEGMRMGTVEAMLGYGGVLATFLPEFDIMNLPYVFENYEQIHAVLNGPIGQELAEKYQKKTGVYIPWFLDHAFRNIWTVENKVIKNMADCKGVKIRSVESPIYVETFRAMGLNPAPLPFGEIYTSVQTHVVDGHEQEDSGFLTMKFYEIEKNCAVTNHIYNPSPLHISGVFLKRLPEATSKAVMDAALEAGKWWNFEMNAAENAQLSAREVLIKDYKINYSYPDIAEFKKALIPLQDKFAQDIGPEAVELLKRVREVTAKTPGNKEAAAATPEKAAEAAAPAAEAQKPAEEKK